MTQFSKHFTQLKAKKAYDPSNSLSLAVACDLAYKNEATIHKHAGKWGFPNVQFISVAKGIDIDTQCFVMGNAKDVVVAFRGSGSIQDWFSNFQAVREPGPLVKTLAHEGFQDALYPTVIAITNTIDSFRDNGQRLWLTGHSLGGALASLYTGMLIENGYEVYGLYTFASPRPGDEDFAQNLNKAILGPHHRIVNEGDIVPHVPPEPFFSHPGTRKILYYNRSSTAKSVWTKLRQQVFSEFMDMVGKKWKIKDNHVLHAKKLGYIPRLVADLNRNN